MTRGATFLAAIIIDGGEKLHIINYGLLFVNENNVKCFCFLTVQHHVRQPTIDVDATTC